jgi:hypothetical protein
MNQVQRSVAEPLRPPLSWQETWGGSDNGLIRCWESGRRMREEDPRAAARAENGELVPLVWKGGVERALKDGKPKPGSLNYLAMWQGLRGDDLDIDLDGVKLVVCARTGQSVEFSSRPILD